MPRYQPDFTDEKYDRLKAIMLETAQRGSFDINDVLFRVAFGTDITRNAGDVAQILDDLVDLGYLTRDDSVNPPRWQLADGS